MNIYFTYKFRCPKSRRKKRKKLKKHRHRRASTSSSSEASGSDSEAESGQVKKIHKKEKKVGVEESSTKKGDDGDAAESATGTSETTTELEHASSELKNC